MERIDLSSVDHVLLQHPNIYYFKDYTYLVVGKYVNNIQVLIVLKDELVVLKLIDEDKLSYEEIEDQILSREAAHCQTLPLVIDNCPKLSYIVINLSKKENDTDPRYKYQATIKEFSDYIENKVCNYDENDNKQVKALLDRLMTILETNVEFVTTHDLKKLGFMPGIIS